MADSDKELKIAVVTTADTSGTSAALSEFEQIHERLSGVYQGARDVRQIFYELDRAVPGLGEVFAAAFEGPLAVIVGLGFALDKLATYLEKVETGLDNILDEDLTGPINQAAALNEQYTGIADAVERANRAFNSAQGIFQRAEKGINAEPGLTPAQKLQAQLGDLTTEDANAAIQAENAKHKVAAYKLPASDDVTTKELDALKAKTKASEAAAKAAEDELARRQDLQQNAQTVAGAAIDIGVHPILSPEAAFSSGSLAEQTAAAKARADAAKRQAANDNAEVVRMEAEIKKREADRAEAARLAGEAAKIHNETLWEANPNNIGSLAWKQNHQGSFAGGEADANAALQKAAGELNQKGPGSLIVIKDVTAALHVASDVIQQLAASGDDVKTFRQQLDALKAQLAALQTTGSR